MWYHSGVLHAEPCDYGASIRPLSLLLALLLTVTRRAPGTAKRGTNGCISNCGTDITNNGDKVADPKRIAYFETWNLNCPCLNMDISNLNRDGYHTHVHWAFANLTNAWEVDVSGAPAQFEGLLNKTGIRRILI